MPFADINGIKMHYSVQGEGIPIILVAGFSADITFFKSLIPELTDKYKVIVFDNRGVGLTEYHADTIHAQDLVDDVLALMDYLRVFRAHILGWSLGAHIVQKFAYQHPERLLSVTLISAYPYHPARSSYFMNAIVDCALKGGPSEYISAMTNAFCFTEDFFMSLEQKGRKLGMLYNQNPLGLKHQMNSLDEFDTRNEVEHIKLPTLSIHGLNDIMVEPKQGDYISDRIKDCKVIRIKDVGHLIKPSLYSKDFRTFIDAHN